MVSAWNTQLAAKVKNPLTNISAFRCFYLSVLGRPIPSLTNNIGPVDEKTRYFHPSLIRYLRIKFRSKSSNALVSDLAWQQRSIRFRGVI